MLFLCVGFDKFFDNLKQMTGWNPRTLIKSHIVIMISTIAPTVILVILYREVYGVISTDAPPLTYGNYQYPDWANKLGWGVALLSILSIPLYMLQQTLSILCACSSPHKSFYHRLKALVQPTELWWKNQQDNCPPNELHLLKVQSLDSCQAMDSAIDLTSASKSASMSTFNHSSSDSIAPDASVPSEANGHINRAMDETEF